LFDAGGRKLWEFRRGMEEGNLEVTLPEVGKSRLRFLSLTGSSRDL
jgi:hypothetical protein